MHLQEDAFSSVAGLARCHDGCALADFAGCSELGAVEVTSATLPGGPGVSIPRAPSVVSPATIGTVRGDLEQASASGVSLKMVVRVRDLGRCGALLALMSQSAIAWAQPAPAAEPAPHEDRRRALYQQGKEAIKAQRWVDARTKLEEAWAISQSYDVALLLAQAEFNLERFDQSARLLDHYFRNVPAKESEKTLANAKQAFAAAKANVSVVSVQAPHDVEVWLDGKLVGPSPLATPLFVLPGRHKFEARRAEAASVHELEAVAGGEQTVVLAEPTASAAAPEGLATEAGSPSLDPSPSVSNEAASARSVVPLIAGGGVALVGVGLGVAFRIASSSSHDRFVELQAAVGPDGCSGGAASATDCRALEDAVDTTDFRRNFSTGAFVVGGLAAVGTAVYWFWPRTKTTAGRRSADALHLSGHLDANKGALWLSGTF